MIIFKNEMNELDWTYFYDVNIIKRKYFEVGIVYLWSHDKKMADTVPVVCFPPVETENAHDR